MHDPVPVFFFVGLFLFLTIRAYFRYKLHLSAVEKGQALPQTPKGDVRKSALVLFAVGLGFAIAMYTTLSVVPDTDAPALAISIWGIVPMLIGAAMWIYWRMTEKERAEKERISSSLT